MGAGKTVSDALPFQLCARMRMPCRTRASGGMILGYESRDEFGPTYPINKIFLIPAFSLDVLESLPIAAFLRSF